MRYPAHTMPSADFCAAVRPPYGDLSPVAETRRRPPEVRPTAFTARPPDLPPRSSMTMDVAIIGSLVRPGRPRYPVLVHRVAALLHASFRPRLAATPLRFANPSPPSRRPVCVPASNRVSNPISGSEVGSERGSAFAPIKDGWIIRRLWSHRTKRWRNAAWREYPTKRLRTEFKLVSLVALIPSLQIAKALS